MKDDNSDELDVMDVDTKLANDAETNDTVAITIAK